MSDSPPERSDCEREEESRLLATIVHDLKNPLSVLLCYAEIIPEAHPSELPDYCQRVYANARTMLDLLDGFALLSDLRDAQAVLSSEPMDWVRLIVGIATDVEPIAKFRDQRLVCDPEGECLLSGDRAKVALAVRHLLLESLRLAPPGANLTMRVRATRTGVLVEVVVPADRDGAALAFDGQRPALELVQRVMRLHAGTVLFDSQPFGAVATIYIGQA